MNIKTFFKSKNDSGDSPKNNADTDDKNNSAKNNSVNNDSATGNDEKILSKYNIQGKNLSNMMLVKLKKNHSVFIKNNFGKKIRFIVKATGFRCPFGVEKYNYKYIINLQFSNMKNNITQNNFTIFTQIDNFLKGLSNEKNKPKCNYISEQFCKELEKLQFNPSIKMFDALDNLDENGNSKYDPLLRVHLKKSGKNITTKTFKRYNHKLEIVPLEMIKGKNLEVHLEMSTMWLTNINYGIIYIANKIVILN
jgi:hypothetical protein